MTRPKNSKNKTLSYEVIYFDNDNKRFLNEKFTTAQEILDHPMLNFLKNRWQIQYIMNRPDYNFKNIKIMKIPKKSRRSAKN